MAKKKILVEEAKFDAVLGQLLKAKPESSDPIVKRNLLEIQDPQINLLNPAGFAFGRQNQSLR